MQHNFKVLMVENIKIKLGDTQKMLHEEIFIKMKEFTKIEISAIPCGSVKRNGSDKKFVKRN